MSTHVIVVLSLDSVCVLFVLCKQYWLPWKQEYHIVMNCKHDCKVSDLALSEQAVLHEAEGAMSHTVRGTHDIS